METRWTRQAVRDLDDAFEFISKDNAAAAAEVLSTVFRAVESLATFPEMGQVVDELEPCGKFRQLVKGKYRIVYEVRGDAVFVMRVWHASRNPGLFSAE